MKDLEQEIEQAGSMKDLGRARKRKLKRGGADDSNHDVKTNRHTKPERRASIHDGPTIRERLVSANVRLPANPLPSLENILNISLKSGSGKSSNRQVSQNLTSSEDRTSVHTPRRKGEPRRSETMYEASLHTETRRITNPGKGFVPRKKSRIFDARSEASPPVMVRGGMGGMAFGRVATSRLSKQKPPRRRIDLPLNVQGAEMRLPAVPFPRLGWRAVSLMMVLMMLGSLFLIWKAPVFQVSTMKAVGLKRLSVSDLNAVMRTFGKSVFTINPNSLDKSLHQAFPELAKISVKVNLPASLKVVVTEREPIITWMRDGSETWVDAEGVAFPPRGEPTTPLVKVEGHGTPPSLPLAAPGDLLALSTAQAVAMTTITPTLRLSPELISSILALSAKMPPDTVLVYDSEHGLGWNDPKGWEVFFGAEDQDMEMKLKVYQALVERLESEGIQPALISVEFVHAPYYRMER